MSGDVLIREAAKARLRPFAVAAARQQARRNGRLTDRDMVHVEQAVESAARAALAGMLPDAGTMNVRQYQDAMRDVVMINTDGLGDLSGWFKSLRKSIKKVGDKIDDGAQSIGHHVDQLNRKVIKEVVLPVTAPTIAHNLDKREDYQTYAAQALKRYEASGKTDAAALAEYKKYKLLADKRLDKVQDTVKVATAVVGAVVVGPMIAAKVGGEGALTAAAGSAAGNVLTKGATNAATAVVTGEILEQIRPEAEAALQDYQEVKAALNEPDEFEALEAQPAKPGLPGWLLPAATVAAAVVLS